jgi:cysteinyl-tRNA synthetase
MIEMIAVLEQKGFAYVNTDGDVCFKVSAYKDYGQLSKQNLMALEQSARIAQGAKESSHDFVLWKKSKPGEPTWHSPWGEGRPGWHIECSAMSTKLLGTDFDLHGGGLDLKFPHHENEIAQSCCAHGGGFAKHWMHVGPLRVNGEKMSKSLGNFITINDALKTHHPEVIRWYLLKTHYRMPMNYELDGLEQARKNILTMYQALQGEYKFDEHHPKYLAFIDQLEDDLNIAAAISMMHEFAASLQTPDDRGALWAMLQLIGVGMVDPDTYLHQGADQDKVEALLQERNSSRAQKDYQNADRIRDELSSMGVVIEDRPSGTHWFCQYAGQIKS